MNIGVVGLGKLGTPVAVAMAHHHKVWGYDINPSLCRYRTYEHQETGLNGRTFQECFDKVCNLQGKGLDDPYLGFSPCLQDLMKRSEIIFIAVQTPHQPEFEGITPLPETRADFDYSHLIEAVRTVSLKVQPHQTVVVISTVLPGTVRRHVLPLLQGKCNLVYNPYFIAMGTVMRDFMNPEFILMGTERKDFDTGPTPGESALVKFYRSFLGDQVPLLGMSYESAELSKVAYNTAITAKICFANMIMEMCHKIPHANCEDVTYALGKATDRLLSPKYMRGGMGDSGACLTADTLIPLLSGKSVPVKDLVGIPEFYVYSYDLDKKEIVPGRGHSCRRTKKKAKLIAVELDNEEVIRVTADHPFLLRNGRYKEAGQLEPGDRLMPLYRNNSPDGYELVRHPGSKKEMTHRMVYRWKYGKNSSNQEHAHHKDQNKRNNDPANILSIQNGEHSSHHNNLPERKKLQSQVMKKLIEDGKINTEEHRRATTQRNLTNNPMSDPKNVAKMREKVAKTMRRKVEDGTHHTVTNNPVYQLLREGRHNFQTNHPMANKKIRKAMVKSLNEYHAKASGFASHCDSVKKIRALQDQGLSADKICAKLGLSRRFVYSRLDRSKLRTRVRNNHKVTAVRRLPREDVYNFEVDVHHNYALDAGVFVHNCHPRDNIAMSWLADKLGMGYNPFDELMITREDQAEWLVSLFLSHAGDMPKVMLGKSFKEETAIVTGSAAMLCANLLRERGVEFNHFDPYVDAEGWMAEANESDPPAAFLITTKHAVFRTCKFPKGSIVVDPFRYIVPQSGVRIIPVGVGVPQ